MPLSEQGTLGQILVDWGEKVREWEAATHRAAVLKGRRDNLISALKVRQRFADAKVAESWARTVAEADDRVQALTLDLLVADAQIDAIRKRLDWYEMSAKAAQTNVATAREEARVWGSSPSVPLGAGG